MRETDRITILNYNENFVFIPVKDGDRDRTFTLSPSIDGIPTEVTMSFADVSYVNGQSDAFRTGMLEFKGDKPEKIYEALNIDQSQILTNKDIEKILLNPTIDGLQKILDVRSQSTFDRIRAVFVSLKNSNSYDLSNRVVKLIENRTDEFRRRKFNTEIQLRPNSIQSNNNDNNADISSLKSQNEEMKRQLEEMKEMISRLTNSKSDNKEKE